MTASPADRQRLKRQRRAEAGMVKVEVWIDKDCRDRLRKGAERSGVQPSRAVEMLINDAWPPILKANKGPIKMVNAYDTGHRYK